VYTLKFSGLKREQFPDILKPHALKEIGLLNSKVNLSALSLFFAIFSSSLSIIALSYFSPL